MAFSGTLKQVKQHKLVFWCLQLKWNVTGKKVHVENKKNIIYYKCVINAKCTMVNEVKIGVEIWMSPSKSPPMQQMDPVEAIPHRRFRCLAFLWVLFEDSAAVQKCLFSFGPILLIDLQTWNMQWWKVVRPFCFKFSSVLASSVQSSCER